MLYKTVAINIGIVYLFTLINAIIQQSVIFDKQQAPPFNSGISPIFIALMLFLGSPVCQQPPLEIPLPNKQKQHNHLLLVYVSFLFFTFFLSNLVPDLIVCF